jgi:hypothetical protein
MTNQKTKIKIGIDIGNSSVKMRWEDNQNQFPAQAGRWQGETIIVSDNDAGRVRKCNTPTLIKSEYGHYWVGDKAHSYGEKIDTVSPNKLLGAPEVRAMLYRSFSLIGDHLQGVEIAVGLPISLLSGEDGKANRDAVKSWILGQHSWKANNKPYTASVAKVLCPTQTYASAMSFYLDPEGRWIESRMPTHGDEIIAIAIGGGTVEVQAWQFDRHNLKLIPVPNMTTTIEKGLFTMLQRTQGSQTWSLAELDMRQREGLIQDDVAFRSWSSEIFNDLERLVGGRQRWGRYTHVIMSGGGYMCFKGDVKNEKALSSRFNGRRVELSDPVFAVADGLLKIVMSV